MTEKENKYNSIKGFEKWETYKAEFRYKYAMNFLKGETVLDVGCGWGEGIPFLKGFKVVGIDRDDEYIKLAKKTNPNIKIFKRTFPPLDFKGNLFDNVICCEVIEHLKEDKVLELLNEIKRVLKDKGILYLTTPNVKNRDYWIKEISDKKVLAQNENDYRYHQKEYSIDEIQNLINLAGFKTIKRSAFNISLFGKINRIKGIGQSQAKDPSSVKAKIWNLFAPVGRWAQITLGRIFKSKAEYQIWVVEK